MRPAELARHRARAIAVVCVGGPLLAALLAYLGTLRYGFVADARFLIADNRYLDSWGYLGGTLTHDYFWSSSGAAIPYWRPLTKLSWLFEARLFGRGALPFHAVQLGWLVAAVAGVYALARRLGAPSSWAGAAALLFALHPTLMEPGCLLMARSDVTAVACALWATTAWHAWLSSLRAPPEAAPRGRRLALSLLHALAFALALGSKESSVVLPAVWSAWVLAAGARGRALATLAPSWLLAVAYLVARTLLLDVSTAATATASLDPLRLFVGVGAYGWALLPLRLSTGLHNLSAAEAHATTTLAAATAIWTALVAGLALAWRRRAATAIGLVTLGLASLLPVLLGPTPHVPGISGKYALADRWLVTAAAAASIGVALGCARATTRLRTVALVALALWAAGSLAVAARAHAYYRSDETMLDLEELQYEETPARFRTVEDRCRARDRQMARAVTAADADAALALVQGAPAECPVDAGARFNLLSALVQAHRYTAARPLVEPLLSTFTLDRRYLGPAQYLAGVTLLHTGDPARGEQLLLSSLQTGVRSCAVFARLADAADAQGHGADAAARRSQYDHCRAAAR